MLQKKGRHCPVYTNGVLEVDTESYDIRIQARQRNRESDLRRKYTEAESLIDSLQKEMSTVSSSKNSHKKQRRKAVLLLSEKTNKETYRLSLSPIKKSDFEIESRNPTRKGPWSKVRH